MGERDGSGGGEGFVPWEPARLDDLVALCATALPDDHLSADDLLGCCWDDPGVVLGTRDGSAAAAAVVRRWGSGPDQLCIGYLKLVAVDPGRRRAGLGSGLLAACEAWAWDEGAAMFSLGGSAPFYLWPGVPALATGAVCLAEAAGYRCTGAEFDMALPSTYRCAPPPGVVVRRVLDDPDAGALRALVERKWPHWWPETARGLEAAACFGAFEASSGRCLGFVAHSVNRAAFLGPMGTDPARQGGGVGHALLSCVCEDALVAGFPEIQIAWVGPARFYAKAGATISTPYRLYSRSRP